MRAQLSPLLPPAMLSLWSYLRLPINLPSPWVHRDLSPTCALGKVVFVCADIHESIHVLGRWWVIGGHASVL